MGKRDFDILKKKYGGYNTEFIKAGSPRIDFTKSFKVSNLQKKSLNQVWV